MTKIEMLLNYFLGPLVLIITMIAVLIGLNMLLVRIQKGFPERALHRQVIMLVTTLVVIFFLIILLPISETLRGQILSLLGILLSAAIALSATTFLGNALAGILLRSVRSFRTGDFIYIQDQFGRVSGRGLFHIEIQTEDRDLVTLPNLFVTNNPVKVTKESGTIVSADVSLGYDIPRNQIETLLLQAATTAGLTEPFVYIIQLGDFSVVYRANGMLNDVKQLLSARSRLNSAILDRLHQADIEIVSPNFMNTRDVSGQTFAAQSLIKESPSESNEPEEIIFDKAEKAANLEDQRTCLVEIEEKLVSLEEELAKSGDEKKLSIGEVIKKLQDKKEQLEKMVSDGEEKLQEDKTD